MQCWLQQRAGSFAHPWLCPATAANEVRFSTVKTQSLGTDISFSWWTLTGMIPSDQFRPTNKTLRASRHRNSFANRAFYIIQFLRYLSIQSIREPGWAVGKGAHSTSRAHACSRFLFLKLSSMKH